MDTDPILFQFNSINTKTISNERYDRLQPCTCTSGVCILECVSNNSVGEFLGNWYHE